MKWWIQTTTGLIGRGKRTQRKVFEGQPNWRRPLYSPRIICWSFTFVVVSYKAGSAFNFTEWTQYLPSVKGSESNGQC